MPQNSISVPELHILGTRGLREVGPWTFGTQGKNSGNRHEKSLLSQGIASKE